MYVYHEYCVMLCLFFYLFFFSFLFILSFKTILSFPACFVCFLCCKFHYFVFFFSFSHMLVAYFFPFLFFCLSFRSFKISSHPLLPCCTSAVCLSLHSVVQLELLSVWFFFVDVVVHFRFCFCFFFVLVCFLRVFVYLRFQILLLCYNWIKKYYFKQ